jgi:threonyl-tRNA synthetase
MCFMRPSLHAGALLSDGPALPQESGGLGGGFFYDVWLPARQTIQPAHLTSLTAACADICKARQPMERLVVSRAFAERLFADNPLKLHLLRRQIAPDVAFVTLYRCGALVDLCRGPHVAHTGVPKLLEATRAGASQFAPHADDAALWTSAEGANAAAAAPSTVQLQRVYGISFVDKIEHRMWRARMDLAAQRDHRVIGAAQKLFFFHKWAPGSAMLLPHGVRIQQRLADLIRGEYRQRGYDEVATPLMYSHRLWQQSGHWQHYRDDMFLVTDSKGLLDDAYVRRMQKLLRGSDASVAASDGGDHVVPTSTGAATAAAASPEGEPSIATGGSGGNSAHAPEEDLMCLKPMNCPGHCLIFASEVRSYRDLPMRFADFSALHRNEASGALTGLTRVRRFEQDDAHIFCAPEQIQDEIAACLDFVHCVYRVLGMSFSVRLSTRPLGHLGTPAQWDQAEDALRAALDRFSASLRERGLPDCRWELNEGDGAFYGPKLDIAVRDALGRQHQCATVQLDFQLPQRFALKFTGADNAQHAPVMVHRAILGSFQRLLAVLIEHTGGRWPYWLSPRQVAVLPVAEPHAAAAAVVQARLQAAGVYADCLASNQTLPRRVREAQVAQYNFIVVVGDEETANGTVAVRTREGRLLPTETLDAFEARLRDMQLRRL